MHPDRQQIKPKMDTRKSLYPRDRDEQLTPRNQSDKSIDEERARVRSCQHETLTLSPVVEKIPEGHLSVSTSGLCGSRNTRGPFCPASISFLVPALSLSVCLYVCLSVNLSLKYRTGPIMQGKEGQASNVVCVCNHDASLSLTPAAVCLVTS